MSLNIPEFRNLVVGQDKEVPLPDGAKRPYVNFDNAATTPPFNEVMKAINDFSGWYSSIHRGSGYKSLLSTKIYHRCREIVADFIGAGPSSIVIFCGNTTDAINRVCHRIHRDQDEVVLTTMMEHHSNQLPWRMCGNIDYVDVHDNGALNLEDLRFKLEKYGKRVKLVSVTGVSNITGVINPLHDIAEMVHDYGAMILADLAQLIAHRPFSMGDPSDPRHIDFVAFSAHKMYAPFGSGVLVGPEDFFSDGPPAMSGGGVVELVTLDDIIYTGLPEKEEAGSPNFFGVLALAKAAKVLQKIGMENVAAHDRELTRYALKFLGEMPGIRIVGDDDPDFKQDRSGVIPILSDQYEHGLLASILGYEWGIGVRHGCFCAHTYLSRLFDLNLDNMAPYIKMVKEKRLNELPGLVRISFGVYNSMEELKYLEHAMKEIMKYGPRYNYVVNPDDGEYYPEERGGDIDLPFHL